MLVLVGWLWLLVDDLDVTFHDVQEGSFPLFIRLLLVFPVRRSVVLEFLHYIGQTLSHVFFEDLPVLQEARALGIALQLVDFVPCLLARVHIPDIEPSLARLRGEDAGLLRCHSGRRVVLALYGSVDVRRGSKVIHLLGEFSRTSYFFMKVCSKLRRFGPE